MPIFSSETFNSIYMVHYEYMSDVISLEDQDDIHSLLTSEPLIGLSCHIDP